MANPNVVCTSCRKPKHELKTRKSKVLPGAQMYLCGTCIEQGLEPRGFLIVASRQADQKEKAARFIKKRKYLGKPILAEELM